MTLPLWHCMCEVALTFVFYVSSHLHYFLKKSKSKGEAHIWKKSFVSCPWILGEACKTLVFQNKVSLTLLSIFTFVSLYIFCNLSCILHFFAGLGIHSLVFFCESLVFWEQKSERAIHSFTKKANRFCSLFLKERQERKSERANTQPRFSEFSFTQTNKNLSD